MTRLSMSRTYSLSMNIHVPAYEICLAVWCISVNRESDTARSTFRYTFRLQRVQLFQAYNYRQHVEFCECYLQKTAVDLNFQRLPVSLMTLPSLVKVFSVHTHCIYKHLTKRKVREEMCATEFHPQCGGWDNW